MEFPLIEWSSVAGRDENEASFSSHNFDTNDGSESDASINSKAEAHAFLDRFLAAAPMDVSLCSITENKHYRTEAPTIPAPHRLAHYEEKVGALKSHNNSNGNKGRLVRSIALGSKLALLDAQMDIVGDNRFRSPPTTSCTYG